MCIRDRRTRGILSAIDARRRLYGLANGRYAGVILPEERQEALQYMCHMLAEEVPDHPTSMRPLSTTAAQFEQLLDLDSELKQILVKRSEKPTPEAIIASYNFHSLETALRRVEWLRLGFNVSPEWSLPVSYTHLDVYKRQAYGRAGAHQDANEPLSNY